MAWTENSSIIRCQASGTEHGLTVSTPFRYDKLTAAPLILCIDGPWMAGTVRDATRIMSMSGEAPEAIVAGLSFTDDTMSDYLRSRASWFTPTQWVPPEITGVKGLAAQDAGRAISYRGFIRDQVLPQLMADYRVSERWLVGHSFSGLFGLQVLFAEPSLFDKYLLASPSIWWDDKTVCQHEAAYAADHDDLAAQVFFSAGQEEDAIVGDFNIVGNMISMHETLAARNYPGLTVSHEILPTETHSSTIGAAISRGLRWLL